MFGWLLRCHKNARLLATYREGLREFLEAGMEHRLTREHLCRRGHLAPYEDGKFEGIARMVKKFGSCFDQVEPEVFEQIRSEVAAEFHRRDALNQASEPRYHTTEVHA